MNKGLTVVVAPEGRQVHHEIDETKISHGKG